MGKQDYSNKMANIQALFCLILLIVFLANLYFGLAEIIQIPFYMTLLLIITCFLHNLYLSINGIKRYIQCYIVFWILPLIYVLVFILFKKAGITIYTPGILMFHYIISYGLNYTPFIRNNEEMHFLISSSVFLLAGASAYIIGRKIRKSNIVSR